MRLNEFSDEDFDSVPEDGGFERVPDGKYTCEIESIEKKENANGGSRLALQFVIVGPSHEGRRLFAGLNLWHSSDTTREYARKDYIRLCKAAGFDRPPGDTDELLGRQVTAKATTKGEYQNVGWFGRPSGGAAHPAHRAPATSPQATGAKRVAF